jgi:hypothetical protein
LHHYFRQVLAGLRLWFGHFHKTFLQENLKSANIFFILGSGMRRFLLVLWITSLVVATCFVSNNEVQCQSSDKYSLNLQGFVWKHSTINALLVTPYGESWWNPSYLNTELRAIGQWNEAIATFASNYSDFSYLSSLKIQTIVSNVSLSGFDLYVNWAHFPLDNSSDEIGLSQILLTSESGIVNCTTTLATHTIHGNSFDDGDMQNAALHELGHDFGLGHSNYTGDLMYYLYTLGSPTEDVSTLDVYGVATLFGWENSTSSFHPINNWLNVNSVILPPDIAYRGLPVSSQYSLPQTLANNPIVQTLIFMFEVLLHPLFFGLAVLFIAILVVIALIPKRKKCVKAGL